MIGIEQLIREVAPPRWRWFMFGHMSGQVLFWVMVWLADTNTR